MSSLPSASSVSPQCFFGYSVFAESNKGCTMADSTEIMKCVCTNQNLESVAYYCGAFDDKTVWYKAYEGAIANIATCCKEVGMSVPVHAVVPLPSNLAVSPSQSALATSSVKTSANASTTAKANNASARQGASIATIITAFGVMFLF
ncbi:UNVERIFIED_CONTAM: hypothetical protein HDU68_008477 [Siphonaria sp. JEL0065]|nr:hypothetical protein HDU68_008477 [Siphonaria sp. JEL0065]